MADDAKVISLAERMRAKAGQGGPAQSGEDAPAQPEPGDTAPVAAQLAWLYCPACKTLEYTELLLPGGRVHNVCGTRVEEAVVDVDARAEYTVAELNLRRLEALARLVDAQRARFSEYEARLRKAAGKPLTAYPLAGQTAQTLPVAEADALGLLVTRFLHDPARRFKDAQGGATAPDAGPESG